MADEDSVIVHEPGCAWENGIYCSCGNDPERSHEVQREALDELVRLSHELGLYEDCDRCQHGGHEI